MNIKRFGVSLEDDLLAALDEFAENNRFPNRSQALRHLIRKKKDLVNRGTFTRLGDYVRESGAISES